MASYKEIYLAGGCFWGTEHYFKQVRGVVDTETGFANGSLDNPSYKQVKAGDTGFAETVHIKYDPEIVGLELLLGLYFKSIDPLSLNRQGEDEGTQYRTGIYYTDPSDLTVIDRVYGVVEAAAGQPLAVEKMPLQNFFPAEEYHQDYLDKNPSGYCHLPAALFEFARKANG
jgi:peptide methionine sulfoxide reductase msrA/msrB